MICSPFFDLRFTASLRIVKMVLLFNMALTSFAVICQEAAPIQNFYPKDYHGENQNWGISQAADKLIYVANSGGLLEYNGADWKLYPSPNESIIRSVKVIGDRIYTGCYMDFGFWQKNELGILNYTSISKKTGIELITDEEFWNIIDIEGWVVFQSLNRIYLYRTNDEFISTIDVAKTITKAFKVGDEIYFHSLDNGIYKIENGRDILVIEDDIVKNSTVINMFPNGSDLLLLTQEHGFFSFKAPILEKTNFEINRYLSSLNVYSAKQLRDNSFLIGTVADGLIHVSATGELIQAFNQNNGLANNTVLAVFEDTYENYWLALDHGISFINKNSPFTIFNDHRGLLGSVYASVVFNDVLYLGTNQGLFFKAINTSDDFKLVPGTQGQVWTLQIIDEVLFCGHNNGTFTIKKNKATKIANIQGTWHIAKLEARDRFLLQGNYDGLYVLEKTEGDWELRNKIEGFHNSSRYFEAVDNAIFVNHEYQGVFKLIVDEDLFSVKSITVDTLLRGSNSGLVKYEDNLLYADAKGVFKYDTESQTFLKDKFLSNLYDENEYQSGKLTYDKSNKKLWAFTKNSIKYIAKDALSAEQKVKSIPLNKEIRDGILGYENISRLKNKNHYLIGTSSGYILVDLNKLKKKEFKVRIASFKTDSLIPVRANSTNLLSLSSQQNNLKISFYTPEYQTYFATHYQYQLVGMYDDWSNWSTNSSVSFDNLPHGTYRFNVRAKIGDSISSNVASYAFEIARPWYFSTVMLIVYVVLLFFTVFFIHTRYKRFYAKRHRSLVKRNQRSIELVKLRNERELIRLKNQQLKEDFKSKSKDLAVSLLSITKKNEVLRSIKEELLASNKKETSTNSVIQIINKSLKENDDWTFFKEAFNNADSKFFQHIKNLHPNLSPNDLKLCAYLRLNLATKEIAQLLNITTRSVEIKRYRLRKKLNLKHEDNLVNYILGL